MTCRPHLTSFPAHDLRPSGVNLRDEVRVQRDAPVRVKRGEEAALRVCERTELFILAESLGGVESLIEHPHRMTHASAAGSPLEVPADLVRLSVGIEDVEDPLADLEQALATTS